MQEEIYRIEVSYPAQDYPDRDEFVDQLVGYPPTDTGLGFGRRDLTYRFTAETEFLRALIELDHYPILQVVGITVDAEEIDHV